MFLERISIWNPGQCGWAWTEQKRFLSKAFKIKSDPLVLAHKVLRDLTSLFSSHAACESLPNSHNTFLAPPTGYVTVQSASEHTVPSARTALCHPSYKTTPSNVSWSSFPPIPLQSNWFVSFRANGIFCNYTLCFPILPTRLSNFKRGALSVSFTILSPTFNWLAHGRHWKEIY